MSRMKTVLGNLALTNNYYVNLNAPQKVVDHFKNNYPKEPFMGTAVANFAQSQLGFYCSEATLPVSSYATAEVKDNFHGVTQEFAHTRLYTDLDFTFYVDGDYRILRFFEGWMDYISGGGEVSQDQGNVRHYYRRFAFPDDYKVASGFSISKFERNIDSELIFDFINVFPKGLTSIPVSYGPADLLKVTVTFNYDRYIVTRNTISSSGGPGGPQVPEPEPRRDKPPVEFPINPVTGEPVERSTTGFLSDEEWIQAYTKEQRSKRVNGVPGVKGPRER